MQEYQSCRSEVIIKKYNPLKCESAEKSGTFAILNPLKALVGPFILIFFRSKHETNNFEI